MNKNHLFSACSGEKATKKVGEFVKIELDDLLSFDLIGTRID